MTGRKSLSVTDYPLAEKRPDLVRTHRGGTLDAITLESVVSGETTMEDLRITPGALRLQAEVAVAAGRPTLGRNFQRAAELVDVPEEELLRIYELLRPGRAKTKAELLEAAATLRDRHGAPGMADFVAEAAEVYERRDLFKYRF